MLVAQGIGRKLSTFHAMRRGWRVIANELGMRRENVPRGAHAREGGANGPLSWARGARLYTVNAVTSPPGFSEALGSPPLQRLREE